MKNKMTTCRACGAELAKSAKVCPHCGAKNKKPVYTKWWFWLLVVLVIGTAASGGEDAAESSAPVVSVEAEKSGAPESDTEERTEKSKEADAAAEAEPITYVHYDVTELFDALKSNALKAEKTFQKQHVELEGYVSSIDSDGKYVSIGAAPDDYTYFLSSVQCYIKSEEQLEQVMEVSVGDPIVIRGKIKSIGEVMGYSLDIHGIG